MATDARPIGTRRLFVAVEVPDDAQEALDALSARWRDLVATARWTPRANHHVTIRFLGATPNDLVGPVTDAVRDAAANVAAFPVALDVCGRFPSGGNRARVLLAGLDWYPALRPGGARRLARGEPASRVPTGRPAVHPARDAGTARPATRGAWVVTDASGPRRRRGAGGDARRESPATPPRQYQVLERVPLGDVAGPGPDPR